MKSYLFMLPLALFLQTGSCDDDSDGGDNTPSNFVTFQGETNSAFGGCNVESTSNDEFICVYNGGYNADGLGYGIAVSHLGLCRTATFNMSNEPTDSGEALFVLQITADGVVMETFVGSSGTVNVFDGGLSSSIEFDGTLVSLDTGATETISGFIACDGF